jgi:ABC-2 type transport system permease protein
LRSTWGTEAHDFYWALRRVLPLLLLGTCVFAVLVPVSTAGIPDISIFNLSFTHDQLKFRFFAEQLPLVVILASAGYGLALGLVLYRFSVVKQQAATYFSLGLSRRALFLSRYLAGVLALVVGMVVPLAVSLLINRLALGATPGLFTQWLYVAFGLVMTGLVAFSVAAIACFVAGTGTEALALSAVLLGMVTAATWGLNALMDKLLIGNAYGEWLYSRTGTVADSLLRVTASFNPLLFFLHPLSEHNQFRQMGNDSQPLGGSWAIPLAWLGMVVVLALVGMWCARRRKAENAGIAGTVPALGLFVTTVLGFAVFSVVFHFLAAADLWAAIAGALVMLALAGWLAPRGLGRGFGSKLGAVGFAAFQWAIAGIILVVLATGGFGYAGRIPDPATVRSVDVSYVGTPSYLAVSPAAVSVGGSYYFNASYSYSGSNAVTLVEAAQRRLKQHGRAPLAPDDSDFAATAIRYDVVFTYHKTDDGTLTRYYDRATLADLQALLPLDDDTQTIAREKAVITGSDAGADTGAESVAAATDSPAGQAFRTGAIYLADVWYSSPARVDLSAARRAELLQAIASDVAAQPAQARYFPSQAELGVLMFSDDGDTDAESFAYGIENALVYLTPDMTNTVRFLKDNGLYDYTVFKGQIESLSFQRYDPYSGWNKVSRPTSAYFMGYRADSGDQFWTREDAGLHVTVTDGAKIAAILPSLRSTYFMSDGGYLVVAKLAGAETYVYRYLPAALAPDFVKKGAM